METEHLFDHAEPSGPVVAEPPTDWDDWESLVDAGVVGTYEPIPADLDGWEPGLFSHAVVASVDREALSGHDLVRLLITEERLIAHLQALQARTIAELAGRSAPDADPSAWATLDWDSVAAELACALHLIRRGGDLRLAKALQLCDHDSVWQSLVRGDIDGYRAQISCDAVTGVDPETARRIVEAVVDEAPDLTSGQLRARLRRLRMAVDPDAARQRYEERLKERRVVAEVSDDGTASLGGFDLPPDRVAEARDRIERIARSLRRPGETRNLDQLRADVYLDLLCGTSHEQPARGAVDIRIDVDTLARLADHPGEIPGFGPVVADVARRLAFEHGRRWQITLTHGGVPVWCDLDHTRPWAKGGATCEHNLIPLCRHHHQLKDTLWTYVRDPDGTVTWTSPHGWRYTTRPPP